MYIRLTARRFAAAATLVLTGALAPLAYATLGKSGSDAVAPLASPLTPSAPATAQAPTSSGDNPYQVSLPIYGSSASAPCSSVPVTEDFVLENVTALSLGSTNVAEVYIAFGRSDGVFYGT